MVYFESVIFVKLVDLVFVKSINGNVFYYGEEIVFSDSSVNYILLL